jgi:hypothetical protein
MLSSGGANCSAEGESNAVLKGIQLLCHRCSGEGKPNVLLRREPVHVLRGSKMLRGSQML